LREAIEVLLSSLLFLDSQNSERFFRELKKGEEPSATYQTWGCDAYCFLGLHSTQVSLHPCSCAHTYSQVFTLALGLETSLGFMVGFQEGMKLDARLRICSFFFFLGKAPVVLTGSINN